MKWYEASIAGSEAFLESPVQRSTVVLMGVTALDSALLDMVTRWAPTAMQALLAAAKLFVLPRAK
jgi:hypothetical protein